VCVGELGSTIASNDPSSSSLCVCVGASGSTIASDDPSSSSLCVVCVRNFLGGSQVGPGMAPLVTRSVRGSTPKTNLGSFCYF
jgi:hypothetical protein